MQNQLECNTWTPFAAGVALDTRHGERRWKLVHFHYTLCVLQRGRADWKYRQRHFSVAPGAVYICEPGEVHNTCKVYCPGDFTVLFLDPNVVLNFALEMGIRGEPHFSCEGLAEPEILNRFARFRHVLQISNADVIEQELAGLMTTLLMKATPNLSKAHASPAVVGRARLLLEDQFRADPTSALRLRPLAQDLGVSYYALLRGFSKYYSVAPYEFVSTLRAQHALSDLRRGPSKDCSTLTAVAHKWGYSDSSHMTRAFRQRFGTTPSAVARQVNPTWSRASSTNA